MKASWALVVVLIALPARAQMQAPEPSQRGAREAWPHAAFDSPRLSWWLDGSLAVGTVAGLVAATQIPLRSTSPWQTQLLPIDNHLKGRYSAGAARLSDSIVGIDVALPLALFAGRGLDRETGKRAVIYAETVLVSLTLERLTKPLMARPRPYMYSSDPSVTDYAKSQGDDGHLSFYSAHTSATFAASVGGAYLFAQSTDDTNARAAVWGVELAMAGATADLRTRAGMHFYSDVIAGALIGSSLGLLIPYLHGGRPVRLSKLEWLAIALGPLAGFAMGELLPTPGP